MKTLTVELVKNKKGKERGKVIIYLNKPWVEYAIKFWNVKEREERFRAFLSGFFKDFFSCVCRRRIKFSPITYQWHRCPYCKRGYTITETNSLTQVFTRSRDFATRKKSNLTIIMSNKKEYDYRLIDYIKSLKEE